MDLLKEFNLPQTALLLIGLIALWYKLQGLEERQSAATKDLNRRLDERHTGVEKRLDKLEIDIDSARRNVHVLYREMIEKLTGTLTEIVRRDGHRG